jgi:hypothetical protein
VEYRYFGRWRVGELLMLIAAGFSATAVVFPWASAGTASVTVASAGDNGTRYALIFILAAVALALSVLGKRPWAAWVGVAMGPPIGIASYLAFTSAEAVLLAVGAPPGAIRADIGISCATAAAIAAFAGGVVEALAQRRRRDDGDDRASG